MKKTGEFLTLVPFVWYFFWLLYAWIFTPPFENMDVNFASFLSASLLIVLHPVTLFLIVIGLIGFLMVKIAERD